MQLRAKFFSKLRPQLAKVYAEINHEVDPGPIFRYGQLVDAFKLHRNVGRQIYSRFFEGIHFLFFIPTNHDLICEIAPSFMITFILALVFTIIHALSLLLSFSLSSNIYLYL